MAPRDQGMFSKTSFANKSKQRAWPPSAGQGMGALAWPAHGLCRDPYTLSKRWEHLDPGSTLHTDPSTRAGGGGEGLWDTPMSPHLQKQKAITQSSSKPNTPLHSSPFSALFSENSFRYPFLSFSLRRSEHPLLNCVLIKQALNKYIPRERGLCNIAPSQVVIKHRSQQLSKSGNKEGVGRRDILPVTSSGRGWHPHKPQPQ